MQNLAGLIKRFQDLKEKTGTSKSSSYEVIISFHPWNDDVYVEFGGYDVPYWDRHERITTTLDKLEEDVEKKVVEAECNIFLESQE